MPAQFISPFRTGEGSTVTTTTPPTTTGGGCGY
jgi:hypothetical protein